MTDNVDEIQLKDNETPDFGVLGNSEITGETELTSRRIEDAVTKSEISNINIDRVDTIEDCKSFLIDFSTSKNPIPASWMKSLRNFVICTDRTDIEDKLQDVNEERLRHGQVVLKADAALYVKSKNGVMLAGYVDSLVTYKILRDFLKASFGDAIKIYKSNGGKAVFKEWKATDTSGIRLKL